MSQSPIRDRANMTMEYKEPTAKAPCDWIEAARGGDMQALGQAMEPFRNYLALLAAREMEPSIATRAGASDLVQETFLAAQRGIGGFRGSTQAEWRAWLEAILVHQLANLRRAYFDTKKRRGDPAARGAVDGLFDQVRDSLTSPSRRMQQRERDAALEAALSRLPAHYQQVIRLHHEEGKTFEAIGSRLAISADAARKLWARALLCLKRDLGPEHEPQ